MTKEVPSVNSVYFCGSSLEEVWNKALRFAGEDGRIATMSDIVDVRIASDIDESIWRTYSVANSAEYFGLSKGGVPILIVAHGVGPISTVDGIRNARVLMSDSEKCGDGGLITSKEFWELENGSYGEVSIIDFNDMMKRYDGNPFSWLTASEAMSNPLVQARLGPRYEEYISNHLKITQECYEQEWGCKITDDITIIKLDEPKDLRYTPTVNNVDAPMAQYALANLLVVEGSCFWHDQDIDCRVLKSDISCDGIVGSTRSIGVRGASKVQSVHPGFESLENLIVDNGLELTEPVLDSENVTSDEIFLIRQYRNVMFTLSRKSSPNGDSCVVEPERLVTSAKKVGEPVECLFDLSRYEICNIQDVIPKGANAYKIFFCEKNESSNLIKAEAEFYKVTIDKDRQLIKPEVFENDGGLLAEFLSNH